MGTLIKDQIVVIISVIILLFTAMINWNIYSWLILVAISLIVIAWYIKSTHTKSEETPVSSSDIIHDEKARYTTLKTINF
ncbi:MAG: hypothetical protein NWE86_01565 [Candidatus Bathyarchaeota archaeon]|nr:hypothetical protein [Candidatus Bathyarchaeota archaeon]